MSAPRVNTRSIESVIREAAAEAGDPSGNFTILKLTRMANTITTELNLWTIPSFLTNRFQVDDNLNINMPSDCRRPVIANIVKSCAGRDYLFPLGQQSGPVENDPLLCQSVPTEPDADNCSDYLPPGDILQIPGPYLMTSVWYFENYGRRETRFYGFWKYSVENNRMTLIGVPAGTIVAITYDSNSENNKQIPEDIVPAFVSRLLQRHYTASNPNLSGYHFDQFRRNLSMFKNGRLSGYRYEDYLDAITSEYTNAIK